MISLTSSWYFDCRGEYQGDFSHMHLLAIWASFGCFVLANMTSTSLLWIYLFLLKKERCQIELPGDKCTIFIVDFEWFSFRNYKLVLKKPAFYLSANFGKTKLRNVAEQVLLGGMCDALLLTKLYYSWTVYINKKFIIVQQWRI